MNRPTISVLVITYMQEAYILQTLESILMQEVDATVEVIVVDDCSPDSTGVLVGQLIVNHENGGWIKYIKQPRNIGMMANFTYALRKCKGDFIAICEGDDYWTDPNKLQKQLDYLNTHPATVLVGHEVLFERNGTCEVVDYLRQAVTTERVIRFGPMMHTCSLFFRNLLVEEDYKRIRGSILGDWALMMIMTLRGDVHCLDDTMAVYRIQAGGTYSALGEEQKKRKSIAFQRDLMVQYPMYKKQIARDIDAKMKGNGLYDYSFRALLRRESNLRIYLYGIRVRLNLRQRLNRWL